jgi:hypothetical protein
LGGGVSSPNPLFLSDKVKSIGKYIVRSLLQAVLMLFLINVVSFALVNITHRGPLAGQGRLRRINPEKAVILKR